MRTFVTALVVAAIVATAYTARMRAAENTIVPEGAKLQRLYTRTAKINGGLTEGPAVAPDGSIYFTDIGDGTDPGLIVRFDPKTKKTTVFTDDSGKANGLACDAAGNLIACEGSDYGGRRVSRWNLRSGKRETIADRYQGKRFNAPNDLCLDSKGRIYFTDPRYLGREPRELEHRAVYRIDADGTVVEITHEVEKPNGIALAPDEKTLYVADHNNGTDQIDPTAPPPKLGAMTILAFPLDADGLASGPAKTIVDYGNEPGCDGMCVDVEGNIYLTNRSPKRPGVMVIDPAGRELAFIPTGPPDQPSGKPPVGLPSNCEFGIGDEATTLYVTIDKSLYRIRLKVAGYHVNKKG
ncbi:MAG: SMP-30/gluconolactonase/LRE family protein [Pirellulales bacterium]